MKVCVLSSGSKGNSTLVITDKVKILIDLGTTTSYVEAALNNLNVDVKETDTLVTFSIEIDVIENGKTYSITRAVEGEKKLGKITSYHEAQTELHTSY